MKIMKRLKREAEPETAIEFAQDLQDLQNGTCKPLPLVSERPSLVPPFLPPESKGTDNRGLMSKNRSPISPWA